MSDAIVTAPYATRQLSFSFSLGEGAYGASGQDILTVSGLRAEVMIQHAQVPDAGPSAAARIFGMDLDSMNKLSVAGLMWIARRNEMTISAGDALTGMSTVFKGIVQEAFPDFRGMPETAFFVRASPGPIIKLKPVQPISYPGAVDVATALKTIAGNAGLGFENNGGVSVQLATPYLPGAAWDQITTLVESANIFATIDSVQGVLAIWPKTGSRGGSVIIAPGTGGIGYPSFSQTQVRHRALFGPQVVQLTRGPGQQFEIQSQLKAANGMFTASEVTLLLESMKAGGLWELNVTGNPVTFGQGGG